MKKILSILVSAVIGICSAGAASLAQQADSAYMAEQYAEAAALYERSIAEEAPAADTYYNLGNAYWRQGQAGNAIISYERALRLDPSHQDARTNLAFVRTKIQDLPEDDSAFLSNLHTRITSWMTPNGWAWTAFILFLAVVGMAALYIFSTGIYVRKTGFFGGMALLCLCVYAIVVAAQTASAPSRHDEAVVTVPTTLLSSTPKAGQSAKDKVVAIHEGTKVQIVDSVSAPGPDGAEMWYDVKINNSTRAWLHAKDVKRI
ncbi:MAG: tetratricopeptide repeat protein [Muribaculaceae bacterium]|nr:tetratricopeptide repeat protein [Muribaculaceae bacterium]